MLDTARLRCLIGDTLNVSPKNIHAYVIGEHGDSEFVPWSNAIIGLNKATDYLTEDDRARLLYDVRNSAYDIINKKGNTSYGIGMCLTKITNAILEDSNEILTVSAYDKENGIYFGMPAIIGKSGIKEVLPLELNDEERDRLNKSIDCIKETLNQINK